jgi:hypothetical protein
MSVGQVRSTLLGCASCEHTVDASGEVAAPGKRVRSRRDLRTPASFLLIIYVRYGLGVRPAYERNWERWHGYRRLRCFTSDGH